MSKIKSQVIIIIIILLTNAGCNKNKDEFSNIIFGETAEKTYVEEQLQKGDFFDPHYDSTTWRCYLKTERDSFLVDVELNPDNYHFSSIRCIKINLAGDTNYLFGKKTYIRSSGPRLKSDVDKIYEQYEKWYGKPDSIHTPRILSFNTNDKAKIAIWYEDNYKIVFNMPPPRKETLLDSAFVYDNNYKLYDEFINEASEDYGFIYHEHCEPLSIVYQVNEYYNKLKFIKDSIRYNLRPNELISAEVLRSDWQKSRKVDSNNYDRELIIDFESIRRKDAEEPRKVIAVRFDIIILDQFGVELSRIHDFTYEAEFPLPGAYFNKKTFKCSLGPSFTYPYSSQSKNGIILERIRKYNENHILIFKADIKAVVFDDNTVCK